MSFSAAATASVSSVPLNENPFGRGKKKHAAVIIIYQKIFRFWARTIPYFHQQQLENWLLLLLPPLGLREKFHNRLETLLASLFPFVSRQSMRKENSMPFGTFRKNMSERERNSNYSFALILVHNGKRRLEQFFCHLQFYFKSINLRAWRFLSLHEGPTIKIEWKLARS